MADGSRLALVSTAPTQLTYFDAALNKTVTAVGTEYTYSPTANAGLAQPSVALTCGVHYSIFPPGTDSVHVSAVTELSVDSGCDQSVPWTHVITAFTPRQGDIQQGFAFNGTVAPGQFAIDTRVRTCVTTASRRWGSRVVGVNTAYATLPCT
jgi:hypothetical protein